MEEPGASLSLWDYRRRMADLYRTVRNSPPAEATWRHWRSERDALFATHPQERPRRRGAGRLWRSHLLPLRPGMAAGSGGASGGGARGLRRTQRLAPPENHLPMAVDAGERLP